jgi:ACR3 family arsenite transporter
MQQLRHITDISGVLMKLSLLDRFLPVWIIGAMALGILLGYFVPAVERAFNGVQIVDVSLPIAIGWVLHVPLSGIHCLRCM